MTRAPILMRKPAMRPARPKSAAPCGPLSLVALSILVLATPALAQSNPHGRLPEGLDCAACHTAEGWTPLRAELGFTHGAGGDFFLTGVHASAACVGCHLDLRFGEPEVEADDCAFCHVDIHSGQFVEPCTACHTTRSFQQVDGETVHARTSFPLTGAHRQVTCESCHTGDVGGVYAPLDVSCESCHLDEYQGALTVDHAQNGYPTDCTECHSSVDWSDAPAFDHVAVGSGFALVGAHTSLRCASCHIEPGMDPLFDPGGNEDCVACHRADYEGEHGPTFPTTCIDCHNVDDWDDADFDHDVTAFPLVGGHASVGCEACHGPPVDHTAGVRSPEDCVACHRNDYDDEHGGSGFPTTCADCHNVSNWEDADFDHDATGFSLTGGHRRTSCTECHGPPVDYVAQMTGPEQCIICHLADYNEEHRGSNTSTACLDCHNVNDWDIDG